MLNMTLWEKGNHSRLYPGCKDIEKVLGLDITRYKTGNISSATLNGAKISNRKAQQLSDYYTSIFYNRKSKRFETNYGVVDDDISEKLLLAYQDFIK